jgi:DHA3 family macrolide efflux protein-like MFS transporter
MDERDTARTDRSFPWAARFFSIWVGQQLSLVGSSAASFALIWWLTEKTGSATVLASASLVAMLPALVLGPFAGALIDRWNRQRIIVISDAFIAFVALWLAYLFWSGTMQVWHVYVVLIARSLGGMFHAPAMAASTTLMVPDSQRVRIAGLNMTMRGVRGIVGPPMGALLMVVLPLHAVMLVDVGTAAFAIAPLLFLTIPQLATTPRKAVGVRAVIADTIEGLRFIFRWRGLAALIAILLAMKVFVTSAFTLTPLLVLEHFGRGAPDLGLLQALAGVGIIAGGLLLTAWGGFRRRIDTVLSGLVGVGLGTVMMGVAPVGCFWLALAGRLLIGLMMPIANGPFTAILQAVIPPEMQGRFFATFGSLSNFSMPIGLAIAGPVSDRLGVPFWFVLSGVVCIATAASGWLSPVLRNIESEAQRPGGGLGDRSRGE